MDFVIALPTTEETPLPPLLVLRNGGAATGLLPSDLGGRSWSSQNMNSTNGATQLAAGGDLGGKGDPKDWNRVNSTGDPLPTARTSCMMAQTNILGAMWTVDDDGAADFDNIQAAIDAAADDDSIMVMPGTYSGSGEAVVNMSGKNIRLFSKSGTEKTIIDGQNARRGITCNSSETDACIIEGFTIQNCESPDLTGNGM